MIYNSKADQSRTSYGQSEAQESLHNPDMEISPSTAKNKSRWALALAVIATVSKDLKTSSCSLSI